MTCLVKLVCGACGKNKLITDIIYSPSFGDFFHDIYILCFCRTGMLKTFENARANNLHPQDKNKLYRKLRGTAVNFVLDVVDLDPRCITMVW